MAAEKKETSKLFVPTRESGKLYKIDDHILAAVSGVVSDANILIDQGRLHSQRHLYSRCTPILVEQLVRGIADRKHVYTMQGSSRPYGGSMMYAGYDSSMGYQLYCSDPSGNYAAWRANATGKNSVNARSILKDEYSEELNLKEATALAVKVLAKSMDLAKPDAAKFEIGVITRDASGTVVQRNVEGDELNQILADSKIFDKAEGKK